MWRIRIWWNKSARQWRYNSGDRSTPPLDPPPRCSPPRCTDTAATCSVRRWTPWSVSVFRKDSEVPLFVSRCFVPNIQRRILLRQVKKKESFNKREISNVEYLNFICMEGMTKLMFYKKSNKNCVQHQFLLLLSDDIVKYKM